MSLPTSKYHRTRSGHVVYKRPKHEFSITDAERIIRRLSPIAEEAPYMLGLQVQINFLWARVFQAALYSSTFSYSDIFAMASNFVRSLTQLRDFASGMSQDLEKALIDRIRAELGIR